MLCLVHENKYWFLCFWVILCNHKSLNVTVSQQHNKYQKEQKHQNSQISSEGIYFGTDSKNQAQQPHLPPEMSCA